MSWPQPTREVHDRFCQIEEWRRVRDARGRTGIHHVTYELDLPDGRVLRTRVSRPVDRGNYGYGMRRHILRDQLDISEQAFWACVQDGIKPDRGAPKTPPDALPADLVHLLISRVGLSETDIAAMSKEDALARLQKYWIDGS
jgi:hypothetical protein